MQGSSDASANLHGPAWFNFLTVLSHQQIAFCRNAGIRGNTTAQMLARLDRDVLAYQPRCVVLMGGTNDLPGNGDNARANIALIVQRLQTAQIDTVLCTIPPRNGAAERQRQILAYNAALRQFAAVQSLPLIDFYPQLVDAASGRWRAGLSDDGTHPNSGGARVMAEYARSILAPWFPQACPYLTATAADSANCIENGLLAQPDGRALPAGWEATGAGDARLSAPPLATDMAGGGLQITRRAHGPHVVRQVIARGIVPGDRLAFSGLIQASGSRGSPAYSVSVQFYRETQLLGQITPIAGWDIAIPAGMFYDEGVVPDGATWALVEISTTAPGTLCVGQLGLARLETGRQPVQHQLMPHTDRRPRRS
jgi:lysophospholipase L1-like esterase